MKQKIRKTPTSRSDAYNYYDAKGQLVITLRPDAVNPVPDIHNKLLHGLDDSEVYSNSSCYLSMDDKSLIYMCPFLCRERFLRWW